MRNRSRVLGSLLSVFGLGAAHSFGFGNGHFFNPVSASVDPSPFIGKRQKSKRSRSRFQVRGW